MEAMSILLGLLPTLMSPVHGSVRKPVSLAIDEDN